MTRSAKSYQGEDMTPVQDWTDYVVWEESEFGTRAWQGEGSASSIVIRDPLGEQGSGAGLPSGLTMRSLASKNLFVVEVDTSTLFRGRVGIKSYSRAEQRVERYRQVECELHDTHWDLDHINVHDYPRGSEADQARIQGLIASYLSGSPRPTTALNGSNYISASNSVVLPETTYTKSSPLQAIREIATSANKQFFMTGDTLTGGSLFYDGNDSTAYACTLSISDRPDEVDYSSVFPPIWNVGPASTEDGSQQVDEIIYFYGSGDDSYVTAHDLTVHTQYGHSSETIFDDTAETADEAQRRANAVLAHRKLEDKTYNVTIGPLSDAQVVLVKHGMTIPIKARAIPDADDIAKTMRIVQCRYTTPIAGTWFAHLQLGRPWKMQPYSTGDKASTTKPNLCHDGPCVETFTRTVSSGWGTSEFGPEWDITNLPDEFARYSVNGSHGRIRSQDDSVAPFERHIPYVEFPSLTIPFEVRANFKWEDLGLFDDTSSLVPLFGLQLTEVADPTVNTQTASAQAVVEHFPDGTQNLYIRLQKGDSLEDTLVDTFSKGARDMVDHTLVLRVETVDLIKGKVWVAGESEPSYTTMIPDTSVEPSNFFRVFGHNSNVDDCDVYVDRIEIVEGLNCTCVDGGPNASSGDSDEGAPADHQHDYVATGGTTGQHLAKKSDLDFDTEWVDAETGGSGVTDHGALTGLTDDDHTQYIKDSEFGAKGRILIGTGSGTFDDLTVGGDGQVLTADSAETTGVKWSSGGLAGDNIRSADGTRGMDVEPTAGSDYEGTAFIFSEHTPGDRAEKGLIVEVGDDYVGLAISEKNSSTVQIYPDLADYDVELLDGDGSGSGSTGKFYIVDKFDNRRPLSNPVSQSAIGTADLAIANTETVVVSKVFAANELEAGMSFMFKAYATRAGTTSASPVIRIRIGTTTLTGNIAATLTPPVNTLAVGNEIEGIVTIRTAGAGGTALGSLKHTVHLAAVTITEALGISTATVAVNTTSASQRVELTFISGSASNTYTFRNAVIYRVS